LLPAFDCPTFLRWRFHAAASFRYAAAAAMRRIFFRPFFRPCRRRRRDYCRRFTPRHQLRHFAAERYLFSPLQFSPIIFEAAADGAAIELYIFATFH
jgi:hypothetical protein